MKPLGADDLIIFMPLAGNEHHVAAVRLADGGADRLTTVRHQVILHMTAAFQRITYTSLYFTEDCHRVLGSRIIGRQDHHITVFHGCASHLGPLATIPVTTAAEDCNDPSGLQRLGCR